VPGWRHCGRWRKTYSNTSRRDEDVDERPRADVSSIVYHYTDTQAFKGVVERKELWATDFRYLNDSLELVYAWQAFVERLEQLAEQAGKDSQAYKAAIEALRLHNAIDLMAFDDAMFVACFSELEDALSQWSRYGANGRGVALGFDSERISALKVPQYRHFADGRLTPMTAILSGGPSSGSEVEFTWNAFLQKVAYGDAERDRVVDGLIDTVERVCADTPDSFSHMVGNCISQTHALVHRLPLVKNEAFEDRARTPRDHHGAFRRQERLTEGCADEPGRTVLPSRARALGDGGCAVPQR
jgi:hypothetical protein